MTIIALFVVTIFVLLPVGLFLQNIGLFRQATRNERYLAAARDTWVSVCIPARNEEDSIGHALEHLCESVHPKFEVLVLDDHSEDQTRNIAESFGIRVLTSEPLPPDWNGKQFACWQLANKASHARLIFMDADVRLTPDAIDRLIAQQLETQVSLLSGFPRQVTGTFWEKLLIPMMHYLLLCYLPIDRMRSSTNPAYSAGCGQLFVTTKKDYLRCGGHEAIKHSRHDGIQLPKAFRRHDLKTDIFDASDIASCRMYRNASEVFRGLLKNANEGIANTRLIFLFTLLLGLGAIVPAILLIYGLATHSQAWFVLIAAILTGASLVPRILAARKFKQSWLGAILNPVAVLAFLSVQWIAWIMKLVGVTIRWRGRN